MMVEILRWIIFLTLGWKKEEKIDWDEEEKTVHFMLKGFNHFGKTESKLTVEIKIWGIVARSRRAKVLE